MNQTSEREGRLSGRVAVITGGASGMGRASALRFAEEGATVVVIDRDAEAAGAVCEEIVAAGGSAEPVVLDITDLDGIDRAFSELGDRHSALDVLFNHAGAVCAPGMDVSESDWEKAVAVNLKAPVFITQAALPLMRRSEHGASLIYTASIAGLVASPNSPIYAAMKGGIVQYMRSVAFALGPEGMRANAICPGPTDTPMLPSFFPGDEAQARAGLERFLERVPLRRPGKPSEVADLALFLAGDESSYLSGVAVPFDGGYVAG